MQTCSPGPAMEWFAPAQTGLSKAGARNGPDSAKRPTLDQTSTRKDGPQSSVVLGPLRSCCHRRGPL